MSLENLQGRFEAHEFRINQKSSQTSSSSHDQALKSQVSFTGGRDSYSRRGRGRGQERGRRRQSGFHGRGRDNENPKFEEQNNFLVIIKEEERIWILFSKR